MLDSSVTLLPPLASTISRSYSIHQIPFNVVSNSDEILHIFDRYWGYFLAPVSRSSSTFTICFDVSTSKTLFPVPDTNWKFYAEFPPVILYTDGFAFLYRYKNKGMFFIDFAQKYAHGCIRRPYSTQELQEMCRNVLFSSIFHILRRHGIFFLHASAVAYNQWGIVVAGTSGQGKTTLLLHLLQAGFQYMSDDIVLLQTDPQPPTLLSLPTPVRICADTTRFFPEFMPFIKNVRYDERGKYQLTIQDVYNCGSVDSAQPALLLLPEITHASHTTLELISRLDAAIQCIPENTALQDIVGMSRENFEILARFIQHVRCYTVRLGQNMDTIVHQIFDITSIL